MYIVLLCCWTVLVSTDMLFLLLLQLCEARKSYTQATVSRHLDLAMDVVAQASVISKDKQFRRKANFGPVKIR